MPLTLTLFASGNYTVTDDGDPTNSIYVIKDAGGNVVQTFANPGDSITILAGVPGVNLTLDIGESLGGTSLTVGSFSNSANSPDSITVNTVETGGAVTLISNGSITERGSDAGADVIAGSLVLSAVTGVGLGSNALETQVSALEAETSTGGLAIRNFGALTIGGLSADVNGLDVLTSGNLTLTNNGSITLSDTTGLEDVHGGTTSGNVTLIANGFDSDIVSNVDGDAITASRGNILVRATRDITFGTGGADFDNDVRASGNITIDAGRDFIIDGFSDMASDDFGLGTGGDVNITATRTISIASAHGTDASVAASGLAGGNVNLTTGAEGSLTLDAPGGASSNSGDVNVHADRILINDASAITANNGTVLVLPFTDGREIFLGAGGEALAGLELSDNELDRIFTGNLQIGNASSGRVSVLFAISPANATDLNLRSGEDLRINDSITIGGVLTLFAGDNIYQGVGSTITAGRINAFVDGAAADGGVGGIGRFAGALFASPITISGAAEADTLIGSGANESLNGLAGQDVLRGFAGNDTLNGGTGADTMEGGLGDDIFVVDNGGDVVSENFGEGTDTVQSNISFTLGAELENLTLTGSSSVNGTGNGLGNVITGNGGNNAINGGLGADTMAGGAGNDSYTVDNAGDTVTEGAAAGTDLVSSSVTFTLGTNIENLTLTGGADINGNGNSLNNTILGNSGANAINGGGGADTMKGGLGDDTYTVNDSGDVVVEGASAGSDTVKSSVTFTLGGNLEALILTGAAAIDGTGNNQVNTIAGNSAANGLNGGGGGDILNGLGGADTLNGGTGGDNLTGGAGADNFVFDTTPGGGNVDNITDFTVVDDTIQLDRTIFSGITANGTLAASAFQAGTAAVDASDRIIYDSATGNIFYDADGVGGVAQVLFATVDPGTALTNADFFGIA